MKTLGEFVGLTDQFVQDQSQVAFLIQTLSMNASLVAARASEQRDPRQFVVVAREFEAIADQIRRLAEQTNDRLSSLEQRSSQIHTVFSVIDKSVQGLSELVNQFTQGVQQSYQVFSNVQSVTADTVQTGEAVAEFNQRIMESAQTTAQVVRAIAETVANTSSLTLISQKLAASNGQNPYEQNHYGPDRFDLSALEVPTVEIETANDSEIPQQVETNHDTETLQELEQSPQADEPSNVSQLPLFHAPFSP
jgi:methyl-accepting chemotaxis protein